MVLRALFTTSVDILYMFAGNAHCIILIYVTFNNYITSCTIVFIVMCINTYAEVLIGDSNTCCHPLYSHNSWDMRDKIL